MSQERPSCAASVQLPVGAVRTTLEQVRRCAAALAPALALLVALLHLLLAPPCLQALSLVDCILSGPEQYWNDLWLNAPAHKLFVSDWTNARILVFDTGTLTSLGTIALATYLPERPQQLTGHLGTNTLFVALGTGALNQVMRVVAIDTDTYEQAVLTGPNLEDLTIQVDESGGRLLAFGRESQMPFHRLLKVIDVATRGVVGTVDVENLMDHDGSRIGMEEVNPVTGEIPFVNLWVDHFVLVNGRTLVGEMIAAPGSAGNPWYLRGGTWNWRENKLYFTTAGWQGYFVFDRDTGKSQVTSCVNDASELFFSAATNEVYSGAEVDSRPTVIDGTTDACWNGEVGLLWGPAVGFVEAARRAYFVGHGVTVFDQDRRTVVSKIPTCIPPPVDHRWLVGTDVEVDQAARRVFALDFSGDDAPFPFNPGPELDYASILVLQEDAAPPPAGPWLTSSGLSGFRAKVRITSGGTALAGRREEDCIHEALCVSGAVAGRPEVFVRVVGPKPNGYLWPTIVKFSTAQVEVWIEQVATGALRYYRLDAVDAGAALVDLAGLADKKGFQPSATLARSFVTTATADPPARTERSAPIRAEALDGPPPPAGPWLTSAALPGFRVKARTTAGASPLDNHLETDCIAETLCLSGAVSGRPELFVRVVGPKPNGRLWPTIVKFSTAQVEVWIEQVATETVQYYRLDAVEPGEELLDLAGLADRLGFSP